MRFCSYCSKSNHDEKDCRKRIYGESYKGPNNLQRQNKQLLYVVAFNIKINPSNLWIVNSGATRHMVHNKSTFLTYSLLPKGQFAYTIDGSTHEIQGIGEVSIILQNGFEKITPTVYHVPNIKYNLFLAQQLAKASGHFLIKGNHAKLYNFNHEVITIFILNQDNLYTLGYSSSCQNDDQISNPLALATTTNLQQVSQWHNRLGHLSLKRLRQLIDNHMVKGINLRHITDLPFCESCVLDKQHRIKFPKQAEFRAGSLLNLIHFDIKGPFYPTHTQFKYFITFIDDFSLYTLTYLLKAKCDALQKFQEFKAYSENFT